MTEFNLTTRELALAMLIALGAAVMIRDVFRAIECLSMAHEHNDDPNKLAAEALEFLGQVDAQLKREEEDEDGTDGN
jgi:hypothetical protein